MFKPEAFENMINLRGANLPFGYARLHTDSDSVAQNYVQDLGNKYPAVKFLFFSKESKLDSSRIVDKGKLVCTTQELTVSHFDVDLTEINTALNNLVISLNLDGFDISTIDAEVKSGLEIALKNDYDSTVARILEEHFNIGGSGAWLGSELDWIKADLEAMKAPIKTSRIETVKLDNLEAEEADLEEKAKTNTVDVPREALEEAVKIAGMTQENDNADTTVSDNRPAPAPEPTIEKEEEVNTEPLTEGEEVNNRVLLEKVRKAYEDCLAAIDESCNTLFVPIKNRIQESLNTNKYTCELCYAYLEVTNDVSSYVYKKLYEADTAVDEFNNNVHRQYIRMGCPGCNNMWNEDITFLEKGLHEIHCPKCNMARLIDK